MQEDDQLTAAIFPVKPFGKQHFGRKASQWAFDMNRIYHLSI